jgi:hypothetical protein
MRSRSTRAEMRASHSLRRDENASPRRTTLSRASWRFRRTAATKPGGGGRLGWIKQQTGQRRQIQKCRHVPDRETGRPYVCAPPCDPVVRYRCDACPSRLQTRGVRRDDDQPTSTPEHESLGGRTGDRGVYVLQCSIHHLWIRIL